MVYFSENGPNSSVRPCSGASGFSPATTTGNAWNAGPRDAAGKPGPCEAALAGHKLEDPEKPVEILRTVHSFDPCIACAVHPTGRDGEEPLKIDLT